MTDKSEIESLLRKGTLGFFNCVEVKEVFAIPPRDISSQPINIFTIIVATECSEFLVEERKYDLDSLKVNKLSNWKFGLKSYKISVEEMMNNLVHLTKVNMWHSLDDSVAAPAYDYIPKKFIPQDTFEPIPMNKLLKNNFFSGSYILEWQNSTKFELSQVLSSPPVLQELSEQVQKHVPLKLASMSDKIGNIVLQIPSEIIRVSYTSPQNSESLIGKVIWHPKATPRKLIVTIRRDGQDKSLDDFSIVTMSPNDCSFKVICAHGSPYKVVLWDKVSDLIVSATSESSFIKTIAFSSRAIEPYSRVFTKPNGIKDSVPLHTVSDFMVGEDNKSVEKWMKARVYKNEASELKNRKEFIQYNAKGKEKGSREQALSDIRYLISKYGEVEVWLWDPYLDAQCILDTMFHNPSHGAKMRAITNLKRFSPYLESLPNESLCGINLQVRMPHGANGWDFHDRFLIFPKFEHGPLAWSLGTSINSLGKEHHILQKVSDGQLISDAFDTLWNNIQSEMCLVWKNN
ncbi:VPA1262 family N-terminal domain-containing protein [Vibrio europaeus]|uniref:VPA1262 family N-terminal domain-containing protein n=1 Tax=Vibrio europaeus TaxID=300876 RepID=A0ABT5GQI7_9VIBR|nr:VPA1262 family N-terminal domain-containing protein [Vibrio europaeus]MDC5705621.1 VPA1262 family N-terminal domain-containing protein [Vibrio europaeus]MDC5710900.1 VPA1262 family N-terminal domain-containing protein [Vibrio europaeus]MDC5715990.1 VPA1262 family N-terminal domain-containing protein [Vibrio europaeus]MDC5723961.1 VPA1262 family N-terminal domain-containing protein [Vibrio europaeus]MDC5729342.1 VPA1262 family N-terminal domain-containing protein [Vibrio europaeus]